MFRKLAAPPDRRQSGDGTRLRRGRAAAEAAGVAGVAGVFVFKVPTDTALVDEPINQQA